MSGTGFQLFSQALSIAVELLHAGLLAAFFRPFVPRGDRRRGTLLVFSLYLLVQLACGRAALPQGSLGLMAAALLTAASSWAGLERPLAFLLTLLYFNARVSSGLMLESLYFFLERWLPAPSQPLEAVFLRAAALVALFLLSHAALFAAMLYALRRRLQRRPVQIGRASCRERVFYSV